MHATTFQVRIALSLASLTAVLVGCSGGSSNSSNAGGTPSGVGGVQPSGGSSNASGTSGIGSPSGGLGTNTSGGATSKATTAGASSTGGAPTMGGATAGSTPATGGTAAMGGSVSNGTLNGGTISTGGLHATAGGSTSAPGSTGGAVSSSSGGSHITGGTSASGGRSGVGGSITGGTSSRSTCATDCNDGFSCTVDTCVNGKCQFVIGPSTGSTACPVGQYCTLDKGCVASLACATVQQCQDAWKDDACKSNIRCDAASSLCLFSVLDKDGDGHAPLVCGGDDCDDSRSSTYPGAKEICNGIDDDCNGIVDDNASAACKTTEACVSGACKCKPENLCNSTCVAFQTDAANCGGCSRNA